MSVRKKCFSGHYVITSLTRLIDQEVTYIFVNKCSIKRRHCSIKIIPSHSSFMFLLLPLIFFHNLLQLCLLIGYKARFSPGPVVSLQYRKMVQLLPNNFEKNKFRIKIVVPHLTASKFWVWVINSSSHKFLSRT